MIVPLTKHFECYEDELAVPKSDFASRRVRDRKRIGLGGSF